MINLIAYIKKQLAAEEQLFTDNKDAIADSNRKTIRVVFGIASFCYAMCFVLSLFVEGYKPLRWLYLAGLAAMLAALLIYRFIRIKNPAVYATALYTLIVIYAAYAGAFVTPKYLGIIILICLFEFPIFIISRKVFVVLFEIVFATIYLMIVIPYKWDFILSDEIVNTLVFMVIGTITGIYFQSVRLNNFELIRKRGIDRIMDETTGLCNRRSLFEYFIDCEQRKSLPYAIAMLDIDWFKVFNDTYGHLAGDHCLAKLGRYFREFGEQYGVSFYRYGGEEFIIVIQSEPPLALTELLETLRSGVRSLSIESKNSLFGFVTVSLGAARVSGGDVSFNPEAFIAHADNALYLAKGGGRNRVVLFDGESGGAANE